MSVFTRHILLGLVALGLVSADLPIHCNYEDIVGTWELVVDASGVTDFTTCGSDQPNTNLKNLEIMQDPRNWITQHRNGYNQPFKIKLTDEIGTSPAVFNDKDKIRNWKHLLVKNKDDQVIGHWTAVFDEGIEIVTQEQTYFAFFKYTAKPTCARNGDSAAPNDPNIACYTSVCSQTSVGWTRT